MRLMQPEQFCLTRLCRYMYCKLENFYAYGARDEINPRAKKSEFGFGVFPHIRCAAKASGDGWGSDGSAESGRARHIIMPLTI